MLNTALETFKQLKNNRKTYTGSLSGVFIGDYHASLRVLRQQDENSLLLKMIVLSKEVADPAEKWLEWNHHMNKFLDCAQVGEVM